MTRIEEGLGKGGSGAKGRSGQGEEWGKRRSGAQKKKRKQVTNGLQPGLLL